VLFAAAEPKLTETRLSTPVIEFDLVVTDLGVVLDNHVSMGPQRLLIPGRSSTRCVSYAFSNDLTKDALRSLISERMFTKFSEITQCTGHFAVQSHSRSPILVPIESSYTTSYID